ncbi:MAG: DUF1127 domain-containing protein [Sediminimonas qiaohouensis]|uniref:DUF1127 domain-containing protein n=1 Tax=Sediminimonas qiaohouensis TaxID=552061 RepID=A0A7C9HCA7_9RHOB|nr:DUF1127 domain-containing protein [Sediminimonas qiaohouensis]
MVSLARQRSDLSELPDHLLNDIGVTRRQARTEERHRDLPPLDHWRL